jgi:hypothetical protein
MLVKPAKGYDMELREKVEKILAHSLTLYECKDAIRELLEAWDNEKYLSEQLFARAKRAEGLLEQAKADLDIQIERQQRMVFKADYDADLEKKRLQGRGQGIQVALDIIDKSLVPSTAAIIRRVLLESV